MMEGKWFWDHINPDMVQLHSIRETLYSGKTQYQNVEIIETGAFGRCLVLDGKIQSSEKDEFIYHESLVHPAMLAHPSPETVFIAGGGEGATLREVLRHPTVKRAVMADLDGEVVDLCRRYLPSFQQGSFDDERTQLQVVDAKRYLERCDESFDVVILDVPEPIEGGPAGVLHTREFYRTVAGRLRSEGIVSLQAGAASYGSWECFTAIVNTLKSVFSYVFPYAAHVPSYASLWGFVVASQTLAPLSQKALDRKIGARISSGLKFYDGLTHVRLFSLPKNLRDAIAAETRVITEAEPLYIYKPS